MDYRSAGVDIDLGRTFVKGILGSAKKTLRPEVLSGIGGFAGLCQLPSGLQDPVLVAGTDGVGTKLVIAQTCGRHDTIGIDLVAMCVNDVLTCGAEPLFFLDYLATGQLHPDTLTQVIEGIAQGCIESGCALLGGETAEMPGFYQPGEYDLAGFCVGVVEKAHILDGSQVQVGDCVLGLPSSGVHSNGYSLVRRIVADLGLTWEHHPAGWDRSLADIFLTPTRLYVRPVRAALARGLSIHGMAHITGGGLPENLPRCLGQGQSVQLLPHSWTVPPEFRWLQQQGQVETLEMFRTFNMGIGYVVIVPTHQQSQALDSFPDATLLGSVVSGSGDVLGLEAWHR